MKARFMIPAAVLMLLCACSLRGKLPPDAVIVPEEEPPVFVDLPQREQENSNLVFNGWVTAEDDAAEEKPEAIARHRDVSKVDNAVAIPSEYAQTGEEISLPVRLCGKVELCALDLKLTYDKNRLEYLGYEGADEELLINAKADEGVVRMNYLHPQNLQDEKELCRLRFRATTQDATQSLIHMEVVEAVSLGKDGEIIICPATAVHSTVWLNQEAGEGE